MNVFRKISKGYETFLSWMDGIASFSIAAIMVLITLDVLSRLLFNKPFTGTAEIVSSAIIIVCFFEIPYVAVKDGHVRTTLFYDMANRNGKLIIDIIAALVGIVVFYLIAKASYPNLRHAINIREAELAGSTRITTIPGRFSIIYGSVLMIIQYINSIIKHIIELVTGKPFNTYGEE